jgi:hypothetical protein
MNQRPILNQRFVDVCIVFFSSLVVGGFILSLAAKPPVHAYSLVGSFIMALALTSFLYFCIRLALADSKRQHHD